MNVYDRHLKNVKEKSTVYADLPLRLGIL